MSTSQDGWLTSSDFSLVNPIGLPLVNDRLRLMRRISVIRGPYPVQNYLETGIFGSTRFMRVEPCVGQN